MKILMISADGDGISIAQRLHREGHSVDMWIKNQKFAWAGKGIIGRPSSWRPLVTQADLVLSDMVGFAHLQNTISRLGKPNIGFNAMADVIELDREKGMDLMRRSGIKLPSYQVFDSAEAAQQLTRDWEKGGVYVKPMDNQATRKTLRCESYDIYEYALMGISGAVLVQDIVEGVEVSTEGWFNGRGWVQPFNHTFEEKRFLNGGLGPNTGCMGNVVVVAKQENELIRSSVRKLTPFLKKIGYRGPIDLNTIVNDEGVWGLEITPRFGYDAIEALMEGIQEPIGDVLFRLATGTLEEVKIGSDVMIAVRVSVAPYPHADPEAEDRGLPIHGLTGNVRDHTFLTDVYKEDGDFRYAGGDGVVAKCTAHAPNISRAIKRVYSNANALGIQDKQYRTDIGARFKGDMNKLAALGYTWQVS